MGAPVRLIGLPQRPAMRPDTGPEPSRALRLSVTNIEEYPLRRLRRTDAAERGSREAEIRQADRRSGEEGLRRALQRRLGLPDVPRAGRAGNRPAGEERCDLEGNPVRQVFHGEASMPPAVAVPPEGEPSPPPPPIPPTDRPDVLIVEAGASRERRCADCGTRTARWKPFRRPSGYVILCLDCAGKAAAASAEGACPACGAPLRPADRFCGRCGAPIEYGCPSCDAPVDAEDAFCAKCGVRLA